MFKGGMGNLMKQAQKIQEDMQKVPGRASQCRGVW